MKRVVLAIVAAVLTVGAFLGLVHAAGSFNQKLSPDQQIVHALNRLTFGPRPGDVEEVRRIGLNKWIELQLHPDQVSENPALEAKLKPLATLGMSLADVVNEYTPQTPLASAFRMIVATPFGPAGINSILTPEQSRKVRNGTAEERTEVLKSLPPDKRKEVLADLPANVIAYTPEFQEEAAEARRLRQQALQMEVRRRNPRLDDLLNQDQLNAVLSRVKDRVMEVLASLDPDKRATVAGLLSAQNLADFPELRRMAQLKRNPRLVASDDLKQAKVFRALYSNRQLEEVLVDFWYNHFNVDIGKATMQSQNLVHVLAGNYERDAIRPHVFGHFKDLLLATAHHPAMLYYLDNWESMAPTGFNVGPFAPRRGNLKGQPNSILPGPLDRIAHGLNENYGREIMELHTLGVNGGYTQADVIAVARCFTGWTVTDPENPEFVFAPFMHDWGEKTVLGHKIPAGGGESDGLQVIDILAHHPSTARFISLELAQRFVADEPPQSLVDRMAQTFTKTDGDLRAVLQTMFMSPEFFSEGAWQSKIKSPLEMVVSAARAFNADTNDTFTLVQKVADLGEPLYGKLEPTGYSNNGETWLSTAGVMGRMNFSSALISGAIPGVKPDLSSLGGKDAAAIGRQILGHDMSPQTAVAIDQGAQNRSAEPLFIGSMVLGSPDFQRR
jgi:uncharacterized protein (DUF1800 family)